MEPMLPVVLAYVLMILYYEKTLKLQEEIVWPYATHKLYIQVTENLMHEVWGILSATITRTTDITSWGGQIILTIYTPTRDMKMRKIKRIKSLEGVQTVTHKPIRQQAELRFPFVFVPITIAVVLFLWCLV